MDKAKKSFVNTHTHIFTIKNVPPLLAKCFLPWPFYYLLHLKVVKVFFKVFIWAEIKLKRLKYFRTSLINFFKTRILGRIFYYVFALGLLFNAGMFLLSAFNVEQGDSLIRTALNKIVDSPIQPALIYNNHISFLALIIASISVSYTHLTLPTILLV